MSWNKGNGLVAIQAVVRKNGVLLRVQAFQTVMLENVFRLGVLNADKQRHHPSGVVMGNGEYQSFCWPTGASNIMKIPSRQQKLPPIIMWCTLEHNSLAHTFVCGITFNFQEFQCAAIWENNKLNINKRGGIVTGMTFYLDYLKLGALAWAKVLSLNEC